MIDAVAFPFGGACAGTAGSATAAGGFAALLSTTMGPTAAAAAQPAPAAGPAAPGQAATRPGLRDTAPDAAAAAVAALTAGLVAPPPAPVEAAVGEASVASTDAGVPTPAPSATAGAATLPTSGADGGAGVSTAGDGALDDAGAAGGASVEGTAAGDGEKPTTDLPTGVQAGTAPDDPVESAEAVASAPAGAAAREATAGGHAPTDAPPPEAPAAPMLVDDSGPAPDGQQSARIGTHAPGPAAATAPAPGGTDLPLSATGAFAQEAALQAIEPDGSAGAALLADAPPGADDTGLAGGPATAGLFTPDHSGIAALESPPPDPMAASSASATDRTQLVDRITEVVERLREMAPPRQLTLDLEQLGGLRLAVSLRAETVHVEVLSAPDGALLDTDWSRELSTALRERGFSLRRDGSHRDGAHDGARQEENRPFPAKQTRRAGGPTVWRL